VAELPHSEGEGGGLRVPRLRRALEGAGKGALEGAGKGALEGEDKGAADGEARGAKQNRGRVVKPAPCVGMPDARWIRAR